MKRLIKICNPTKTLFSFACILMLTFQLLGQGVEKKKKPNILLILVDDLKPALGTYGDNVAISPNIDKLANQGIQFNRAYANQAVCAPSRYNLMLGSRSTSTGLYNFGKEFRDVYPDAITLPQYFKTNGYHVESMGKVFHIGHGNKGDDASWSIPHRGDKVIEYVEPTSTNRKLTREEALFENYLMNYENPTPIKELPRGAAWESPNVLDEAYADGRVARLAVERLRELKAKEDKPFFMAVGFVRPHLPFSAPRKYWDLYDKQKLPLPQFEKFPENAPEFAVKRGGEISAFKPVPEDYPGIYNEELKRNLIHGYYASMSYMDAQVGTVIDELKRLQLDENTIVVLWGDHGWHLGDHGIWTKHTNYEQATKIPVIMVVPGVTKPGSKTEQAFETVDIYPTLVELAGLQSPVVDQPIDGLSMASVLENPKQTIRDHVYHCYIRQNYLGEAIRNHRYRMVRWTHQKNPKDVVYELYDFENDPLETNNIAESNQKQVKKMLKILEKYPKAKR
ncbi:sulfatase [Galbibacter mesophilus]|uniref:sulfatase n=1 Tax=Galbibacter mesophilus TaxID=379069 RepID=UPI00191D857E|nr:sulfatase [Galbibacter mesophilus]MCM5661799.1 sulfatase [Galbibacter mesophilus]